MRFPIGIKIFGIAALLAVVMIVAAVLSETRVRRAEVRITALAEHLLPLADRASELRAISLREEIAFRQLVDAVADGRGIPEESKSALASHASEFDAKAGAMRTQLDAAIMVLPSTDRKLALTDVKARLQALIGAHGHVQRIAERIAERQGQGRKQAEAELISLFESENRDYEAADAALVAEIRNLTETVARASESDETLAIAFEHIVTAIAVILGLLFAGLLARALVQPIKRLRSATIAVEEGDLSQQVPVRSRDELADLADSFNRMVVQLRRKERTETMFGRYVDPRVVQQLIEATETEGEEIAAGEKQEATILFSDIAGYTGIGERLTPVGLVRLMNEYFNLASEPIASRGGLLDKFIGDAVMAFWCPPFTPAAEIGRNACAAALAETRMVRDFAAKLPDITGLRSGIPPIDIRVGVATGEVVVGSIGSDHKRNFTAVGDTVNLSSRLEGANKAYGTQILICGRTRDLIDGEFTVREIDLLTVAGKTEPVRIFELLADGPPEPDLAAALDSFAAGLDAYRQADWHTAARSFTACLAAKPGDPPSLVFLERIEQLKSAPPEGAWDGVWRLTEK